MYLAKYATSLRKMQFLKWHSFSYFDGFAEVESDLPDDIKEKCVLCFQACMSNHMNIGDAIKKVQSDPLKECDERFKGQRFKVKIKK